jgi:DNA-binding NtrC family response regulator
MADARLLVVDDDERARVLLARFLEVEGYAVDTAKDGADALVKFDEDPFDVVITDLKMPNMDGIDLLRGVREKNARVQGIVVTGFASIDTAVEAMKAGAFDYVSKPFQLDEIRIVVQRALDFQRLQTENFSLKRQLKRKYRFENIVGDSSRMQEVFRLIEKVCDSDSTILISGDSGTGKELVARAVHYNSPRKDRFLVPVNCGAIPENLLESELFGHVKGAFTGASTSRIGRFEAANGGSIFLDEIGDMSPKLQVKVLRVIQEQEFEPVGSTKTKKVDVRIIAASNQDLEKAVARRTFREDLYYRLNVIPIHLPALRERVSDIPLLANHFLRTFAVQNKRPNVRFAPDVMEHLCAYEWPGNVRELENLIERVIILTEGDEIRAEDLPEKINRHSAPRVVGDLEIPETGVNFNSLVDEFENQLIRRAMDRARGNKNLAAKLLNLKRTTLVEKIKKKGMVEQYAG